APSARLSVCCPSAADSCCRRAMLFVDHKPIVEFSREVTNSQRPSRAAGGGMKVRRALSAVELRLLHTVPQREKLGAVRVGCQGKQVKGSKVEGERLKVEKPRKLTTFNL